MSDIKSKLEKAAARKAKRKEKSLAIFGKPKRRRSKSISNSKLDALRWEAFAAVIRERDEQAGCISCAGRSETAGHMLSRRKLAVKYNEKNVNGQCSRCNWADKFLPGYHDHCVTAFMRRYSQVEYAEIVELSKQTCRESRTEKISSAWEYMNRMKDGERKEKIRVKLAPIVPVQYGGERS